MWVRTTWRVSVNVAVALLLVSAGSFLVYAGLNEYFGAQRSQEEAEQEWREASGAARQDRTPTASVNTESKPALLVGSVFSHLEVPRLKKSLYVVEGASPVALKKGPGHVRGTAMPGENGNCVIAAHRDLHFRFLKDVQIGDRVFLDTAKGRFQYRVTAMKIISPTDIAVLQPTRDAELHLITCYPFYFLGHAPKRYVVTAKLQSRHLRQLAAASGL